MLAALIATSSPRVGVTPMPPDSDEELMRAHADGDPRAFDVLFRRHVAAVLRFFGRSFRDGSLAEDLTQQVFLRVHRSRATFQPGSAFRPWLFAVAGRVRLDEWARRKRSIEDLDDEGQPGKHSVAPEPASAAEHPITAALEQLTEPQRLILHLHRVEGMTFREIGETMQLSEGAVKLRAFRAYERLRALVPSPKGGQP